MRELKEALKKFYQDRLYMLLLALTAVCSYGFMITHHTVGMDDTPYAYYFEEGLAAIVGRWVMYLVNKVVHIAEFAPFLTDLWGVLLLMAAALVWCDLIYVILGEKVPRIGYIVFACVFVSCPLHSEVFTYYLHNGVGLGYLFCGISLYLFWHGLKNLKKPLPFIGSAVCLWIALGCYESFMLAWLLGLFLMLLTERFAGVKRKVFLSLCIGAGVAAVAIVLRGIMIAAVTGIFGLEYLKDDAVQRSITEMAGWIFAPGAASEFAMILKRVIVMYGVFAYAYYPIKIFVAATVVIVLYSIYHAVRRKDIWAVLLCVGGYIASFLLVIIEGKATYYRQAQFLPVICAYGALLAAYLCRNVFIKELSGKRMQVLVKRAAGVLLTTVFAVILLNQCVDMNRWFYVDYRKYENAKDTMRQVDYELRKNFTTEKPIVFTGIYEIPRSLVQDAYVEYNSDIFCKIQRMTNLIDEHLLDKFYRDYGVWVAQSPSLSLIEWGRTAFGDDAELTKFANMHGYELKPLLGTEYEEMEKYSLNLPEFPKEGSIVDMGDYIIVHF